MTNTPASLALITDGGTFTIAVSGVAMFSDSALTVPLTFPQTISSDTTWYAAQLAKAGARQILVKVTASDGTVVPVPVVHALPAQIDCAEGVVGYGGGGSTAASSAPLPDRWMGRFAGAIDWTSNVEIPWTDVDRHAGSAFGEWSVDGTTFTFTEDVRARVVVQIAVVTNAAASGVIGFTWTANVGTAASAPTWATAFDNEQGLVAITPSASGHAVNQNVEIFPELLWKAGNFIDVQTHVILAAGAIDHDAGTNITIFAAGADPNP